MALRIGKKKSGDSAPASAPDAPVASSTAAPAAAGGSDDWSDFGSIPHDTSAGADSTEDWTSFDDLVDPSLDTPPATTVAADAFAPVDTTPDAPAGKGKKGKAQKAPKTATPGAKKGLPKAAIIAIPILLVAAGGGAFLLKQSAPPVDEMPAPDAGVVRPPRPARPTAAPPKVAAAPKPAAAKPAKPGVPPVAAKPGTVPPGAKPGATPAAAKPAAAKPTATPIAKPAAPGERTDIAALPGRGDAKANAAAMEVPDPPKTAEPGVTLEPHHVALGAKPDSAAAKAAAATAGMTPAQVAKRSQLKAMWNDGAAAKKAGKKAEARKIWTKGLKLAEASPRMDASAAGFKGSLAKLK